MILLLKKLWYEIGYTIGSHVKVYDPEQIETCKDCNTIIRGPCVFKCPKCGSKKFKITRKFDGYMKKKEFQEMQKNANT